MLEWVAELLFSIIIPQDDALDTKKIDRHIARLNQFDWFKQIYTDESYHRSFFVNRKVRWYLQSSLRVNRMIKKEKAQRRFLAFLDRQVNR
ncbi:hypothetical protein [Bacillus badius]|uniref:Mobile element protein n=1 Tax=Bacillus badius TaxID=1455 RepID=A0ABR5ARI9_BACBA|nr:hypothetical protein [Bacillus badius]KIL72315.1 hypothetical protein SD78_4424 [Bacillus badius]KIL75865.1 hypothetical protein SD77_2705 [Bacillus badius]KZR58597.1 hypothetical protein A3781_16140 [Bacillus badius]MED4717043.1 hypothetical protein [Bacillus badius]